MKARPVIIGICLALCVAAMAGVVVQGGRLYALRAQEQQLQLKNRPLETNHFVPRPSSSPSSELLRLRSQVSLLSRRQRELAGVQSENQGLQTQVAVARTNAAAQIPAGYIRKSEARKMGFATPEATVETFLWAYRNHDLEVLLSCYPPEAAATIKRDFEKQGGRPSGPPGINVIEHRKKSDDYIELVVEFAPGSGTEGFPLPLRRINGEWKLGQ